MNEIGIGILGCGWMGQIHAKRLAAISGVKITAAYDYSIEPAQMLVKELGGKAYSTPEELYTSPDVDAVYICTRHDVRHGLFELSLKYEKPTFCEKPLAMTIDEAIWVTREIRKSGLLFSMGFNQRQKPVVRLFTKLMKEIGFRPSIINLSYVSAAFLNNWTGMPDIGGGILTCLGSHILDLCRYLVQDEVDSVSCFADRLRLSDPYLQDATVINLRFKNGALATMSVSDHGCSGYKKITKQHLTHLETFNNGRVLAMVGANTVVEAEGDEIKEHHFDPGSSFEEANGYWLEAMLFVEELRTGKKLLPGVKDGLEATRLVEAARRSMNKSNIVKLDEIPNI